MTWPPPHFYSKTNLLWPFLLCASLVCGITASIACLKYRKLSEMRQYFDPLAAAESLIAICSGALLWIGYWDFLDSYLVPNSWWSKLCMLLVGALGALATRSLYAEASPHPIQSADGTCVVADEESVESPRSPALPDVFSPRPRALGAMGDADEGGRPAPLRIYERAAGARTAAAQAGKGGVRGRIARAREAASRSRWCFLSPPKFSGTRCARALLATFSGLTMWVGLWDLLDAHLLPSLFHECRHEPSMGCAVVKLSLVAIGALGLYLTRSLYGEEGQSVVQFQRL